MQLYLITAFLNQSVLFKNAILPNSRILKTIFILTLKRATYAFILAFLSDASFSLLFLFSCFFSSSTSLHCLLHAIVNSFWAFFLLHHWFIYFFSFILFVYFLALAKVTTVSLPAIWVFVVLYLLRCWCRLCCRPSCCLHAQGWWCFNFF